MKIITQVALLTALFMLAQRRKQLQWPTKEERCIYWLSFIESMS